jgi:hypothetical protein
MNEHANKLTELNPYELVEKKMIDGIRRTVVKMTL